MKRILNLGAFVALIAVLLTYSSCGPTPGPSLSQADQQLQKLLGTEATSGTASLAWKCTSATLDGVDKKANYTSAFTLTLSGEIAKTLASGASATFDYTTSKPTFGTNESPLSPWAASGKFTFDATNPESKITRDDGIVVTYTVSSTELSIIFTYSGNGFNRGRTDVVPGAWVFKFSK
jgi:hypothetical protein